MNNRSSKIKEIITWREFRAAWVLLAIVVAILVFDLNILSGKLAIIEGALLFLVLILVTTSIYRTSSNDRNTSIDRGELKTILASLSDSLIIYSADFRVTLFNPAAARLFKLDANDVVGHIISPQDIEKGGWRELVQTIFPSLAPRVTPRTKEGEYPQVVDISFPESELELRVTTSPILDDSGKILAFMKIIRNRTPQIMALRSKSEFVAVASHQLQGPVTDINWALQALGNIQGLDENSKVIMDNALLASQSLLRRIEDLLNIAKMEDGQFGYKFEETDISDFISKVLNEILPAAQRAGVKVYFDRPSDTLPHVMIDPKRLSLALVNLLENAIRYNVENGEVTVKVDQMQGKPFLVVSVRDTGIGIPPESMGKLFSKFYRADNAQKHQTEGSGLGLYIAKGIVNAHGGQIWAESELNRGSIISFALPTDPNLVPRNEVTAEELA